MFHSQKDVEKRFNWDHPSQGMVFHRTMEQAFGTGDRPSSSRCISTADKFAYFVAAIILVATIVIYIIPISK